MTAFTDLTADHSPKGWRAMVRVERFGPDFPGGGWLVAGGEGLGIVSPAKTFTRIPLPDGFQGTLGCMAVQPTVPGDLSQPRVVLAAYPCDPADPRVVKSSLYQLRAGGGLEPLGPVLPEGGVSALALNRHGDLFLATLTRIYRAFPGGDLMPFAGGYLGSFRHGERAIDGHGGGAVFDHIRGLTLDPATDDLYASDAGCIRRITPTGDVTTPLGTPTGVMNFDRTFERILPGQRIPPGKACLAEPSSLQFKDGVLFIVDRGRGAILAYNTASRSLFQLVDGGYGLVPMARRFGPLRTFFPDLLASETAMLSSEDGPLCLAGEGSALYVDGASVVHLDFPKAAFGAPAAGRTGLTGVSAPAGSLPAPAAPPPGPAAPPATD
jgi:hypothetical protein